MIHKFRMELFFKSSQEHFQRGNYVDAVSRLYYAVYHLMKWQLSSLDGKLASGGHNSVRVRFSRNIPYLSLIVRMNWNL